MVVTHPAKLRRPCIWYHWEFGRSQVAGDGLPLDRRAYADGEASVSNRDMIVGCRRSFSTITRTE